VKRTQRFFVSAFDVEAIFFVFGAFGMVP